MTNRTRTNFYISKGPQKLAELVSSCYKNGCVGIVYENEKVLDKVSKALYEKGNTIKCRRVNQLESQPFEEYIRYYVGIGDGSIVDRMQTFAGENLYCFYCLDIEPDFFSDGLLINAPKRRFAEFAYFDSDIFNLKATKIMSSGYSTLFSLLISLYDRYCVCLHKPFKDAELEMLIKKIKGFLLYRADYDVYYQEMISLIKKSVDWLNKEREIPLVYRIRYDQRQNWCKNREFFVTYLLFYLGIIFTKWDFNDMLIPVATLYQSDDKLVRFLSANPPLFEKLFVTKKQLGYIAGIYRNMTDGFEEVNLYKAMTLIKRASAYTKGLYNQIHKKGIIEGIINYEKH